MTSDGLGWFTEEALRAAEIDPEEVEDFSWSGSTLYVRLRPDAQVVEINVGVVLNPEAK